MNPYMKPYRNLQETQNKTLNEIKETRNETPMKP